MTDNVHQLGPRTLGEPKSEHALGRHSQHDHVLRGIHLLQRSRHSQEAKAIAFVVEATNSSRIEQKDIKPLSDDIIAQLPMNALARAVTLLAVTGYEEESDAVSALVGAALGGYESAELIPFDPR